MPRVDAILRHPLYAESLAAVERAEAHRVFCKHGLPHLLDVARVAWCHCLEHGVDIDRELVYAAALLHDIGRAAEYEMGESHDIAGVRIAREILGTLDGDSCFSSYECELIVGAVAGHRSGAECSTPLACAVRFADKASRPCFSCAARHACNWPDEKKNLRISW